MSNAHNEHDDVTLTVVPNAILVSPAHEAVDRVKIIRSVYR